MANRLGISSKDLRYVIVFFILITTFVSATTYLELNANPVSAERFFAMWILGSTETTANYFPNNNTRLALSETVGWTVGVRNQVSDLEYVVVQVKLLNSTDTPPNEQTGIPSPRPILFEFARILTNNETWLIPFTWSIKSEISMDGNLQITGLVIDETSITGNLAIANSGINFRFIFELWYYNPNSNELAFSWSTPTGTYSVWDQLWFNATTT